MTLAVQVVLPAFLQWILSAATDCDEVQYDAFQGSRKDFPFRLVRRRSFLSRRNDIARVSRCECKGHSPRVASRISSDGTARATHAQSSLACLLLDIQEVEHFSTASPARRTSCLTFPTPISLQLTQCRRYGLRNAHPKTIRQCGTTPSENAIFKTSQPSKCTKIEQGHVGSIISFVLPKRRFHH
jgi:hypothetical protein